jgi:hypothetical protein
VVLERKISVSFEVGRGGIVLARSRYIWAISEVLAINQINENLGRRDLQVQKYSYIQPSSSAFQLS